MSFQSDVQNKANGSPDDRYTAKIRTGLPARSGPVTGDGPTSATIDARLQHLADDVLADSDHPQRGAHPPPRGSQAGHGRQGGRHRRSQPCSPNSGGLPASTLTAASSDDAVLTGILYEKRYSLMMEGNRWVDMRRYNKLNLLPLDIASGPNKNFVAKVMPIPQARVPRSRSARRRLPRPERLEQLPVSFDGRGNDEKQKPETGGTFRSPASSLSEPARPSAELVSCIELFYLLLLPLVVRSRRRFGRRAGRRPARVNRRTGAARGARHDRRHRQRHEPGSAAGRVRLDPRDEHPRRHRPERAVSHHEGSGRPVSRDREARRLSADVGRDRRPAVGHAFGLAYTLEQVGRDAQARGDHGEIAVRARWPNSRSGVGSASAQFMNADRDRRAQFGLPHRAVCGTSRRSTCRRITRARSRSTTRISKREGANPQLGACPMQVYRRSSSVAEAVQSRPAAVAARDCRHRGVRGLGDDSAAVQRLRSWLWRHSGLDEGLALAVRRPELVVKRSER